ncbi:MAG: choice-of-anchor D domain-containing protein [Bacteroidales bacterium]|nr:choice-of-anchor D domain-containing protein [Bacteroidales bacterium]
MKRLVLILIILLGGLAARADNIVVVSSASGHPQDEVTLQVSLANTDAAVAFQAEIPLGSQLTYVAGSVALNPGRITDHQVSAAVVNGSLRIYAYSLNLTPFVGSEGNLLSFTLRLKNEPGDFALELNETKLSDASGNALPVTTSNGMVTILSPKLQINTTSINFGHVPIWSEYTQNASVTNVGNEPLTITAINFSDAVFSCPSFMETTLQPGNSTSFAFKFAPMVKGAVTATATVASNSILGNGIINLQADPFAVNEIHIGYVTGYCDSIVALPISMNNMEEIIGLQIEAYLNDALEFIDFTLSDRKTDHVATGIVSGTTLRLMAYSPSGSAFTGDDGVIGTVRFRLHGQYGNYYLNPSKAVLADANGENALSNKYQGYVTVRSPRINGNSSLSFGSSPVTETVTREYVVRNQGNASMRIDQVVFDQTDFSVIETFPIVVEQGATTILHVSYNREQKGNYSALMKIYSNDPQNGLKNVTLSGSRYEPNSISLVTETVSAETVTLSVDMSNYSGIVALQADFQYPYQEFSLQPSDFQLMGRFANHSIYALPSNDSTFRILVLSMQNDPVEGHDGAILKILLHPIGTPLEEYTATLSEIVLSEAEGVNVFSGEETSTTFSLTTTQTAAMASGWNWWSTYIEQSNLDGLTILENSLGHNGLTIKSQNEFVDNYYQYMDYDYWYGSLEEINNEQGYLVNVTNGCGIAMVGVPANPENHTITIQPNWNWIGYPVNIQQTVGTAMGGFISAGDDVIKSQTDYAFYYEGYGWYPDDFMLTPGAGYKYHSNASENKTLTYSRGTREVIDHKMPTDQFLVSDSHIYANNLNVTAIVVVDDVEQYDKPLMLGAFVNGMCRGCTKLRYFEPLDRYYAMLTVAGENGEKIKFGYMDAENGKCKMIADESVSFVTDAIIGKLDKPFEIHFNTDNSVDSKPLSIYPNPIGKNMLFCMDIPQIETITELTITNVFGAVVRLESGLVDTRSINGPMSSGVYLVEVVTLSGNIYHGKLIVK